MKQLAIVFILFFLCVFAKAQFPATQYMGNQNTLVKSKGAFGSDSGYVYAYSFPDTATANRGFLKNIGGITITVGNDIYMRTYQLNKWIKVGEASVSQPANQIVFGSGVGISSSPNFQYFNDGSISNVEFNNPNTGLNVLNTYVQSDSVFHQLNDAWGNSMFIHQSIADTSLHTFYNPTLNEYFDENRAFQISGNTRYNEVTVFSNRRDTSGFRLFDLRSTSPTKTGSAIGVDDSGYVVRIAGGGSQNLQQVTDLDSTTTHTVTVNSLQLNTTPTTNGANASNGELYWDNTDNTGALVLDSTNGVVLQLGQEQQILGVNKTGATLTNGTVVFIRGAQGNRPKIEKAHADSIVSSFMVGVVTQDIANNQEGYVTTQGIVHGINTTGLGIGDNLYLSATTAGTFSNTHPVSPNNVVRIGVALNSTVNGSIYVNATSPVSADTLFSENSDEISITQKAARINFNKKVNYSDTSTMLSAYRTALNALTGNKIDSIRSVKSLLFNSPSTFTLNGTTGVITETLASQAANSVFRTTTAGTPSFGMLDSTHVPALHSESYYNTKYAAIGTIGNLTENNIWTGLNYFRKDGIGTTPTEATRLENTTTATSGNAQYSPYLNFSGKWYNTTSLTSNTFGARIYANSVNGPNSNPGGYLNFQTSPDGVTWTDRMGIYQNGFVRFNSAVETNNINTYSGNLLTVSGGIYSTNAYQTNGFVSGVYVGGNPSGIASSALFHISSTSKGSIPFPKMTSSQRTSVSSPVAGLLVYDTDLKRLCWYDNSQWNWYPTVSTGTAAPATTPAAVGDTYIDTTNKKIYTATGTSSSSDWTILN